MLHSKILSLTVQHHLLKEMFTTTLSITLLPNKQLGRGEFILLQVFVSNNWIYNTRLENTVSHSTYSQSLVKNYKNLIFWPVKLSNYIYYENKDWLAKFHRNLRHHGYLILDCYSKYILNHKIINTARQKLIYYNNVLIFSIWLAVDFQ